jgi:hypothetical protein
MFKQVGTKPSFSGYESRDEAYFAGAKAQMKEDDNEIKEWRLEFEAKLRGVDEIFDWSHAGLESYRHETKRIINETLRKMAEG